MGIVVSMPAGASPRQDPPARPVAIAPDPACTSCFLRPARAPGQPLLIVLHGDGESARETLRPWEAIADERDLSLFAPTCPLALGCESKKFWQWNGDPSWITSHAERLITALSTDPEHVWLAGWSGGASYIGYRAEEWGPEFTALVFAGGGIPPRIGCGAVRHPSYFLVGDHNPLHHLAAGLRAALAQCAEPLEWQLLPGADHGGERRALASLPRLRTMVDWLMAQAPRTPSVAAVGASVDPRVESLAVRGSTQASAVSATTAVADPTSPLATSSAPKVRSSQSWCTVHQSWAPLDGSTALAPLILGFAIASFRQRRRGTIR